MTPMPRAVIVGCGDLGSRLGLRLLQQHWQVYGLRRNPEHLPEGIQAIAGDIAQSCPPSWPQGHVDYLIYAVSANTQDSNAYQQAYPRGLQQVLAWLAEHHQHPKRLIFVSSTGVYHQQDGSWVDETSPTQPETANAQALRDAENIAINSPYPATSVRFAGLYGPNRNWLINQVRQGIFPNPEPVVYTNRIHIDDAASLLAYLLIQDWQGQVLDDCYIGVDDHPAPLHEVCQWLAEHMSPRPALTTQSLTRRAGSKRCSNARIRALGWVPQYPSYQQGYTSLMPF